MQKTVTWALGLRQKLLDLLLVVFQIQAKYFIMSSLMGRLEIHCFNGRRQDTSIVI